MARYSLVIGGALVLSGCSAAPGEEATGEVQLALVSECNADSFPSRSVASACTAAARGSIAVDAAAPTSGSAGPRLLPGQTYGLRLVESPTGSFVGRFRYRVGGANRGQRHAVYVGTPSVPLSIHSSQSLAGAEAVECRRYLSDATKNALVGGACADLNAGLLTAPLTDDSYDIDIGPTPSRWVRFYIEPEDRSVPTQSTSGFCGAPSTELCEAGATPSPVTAASPASLQPPSIQAETVYGVRLVKTWDDHLEGALVFVPPSTGDYALSLGTPYFPVRIREEGKAEPVGTHCAALVPDGADCGAFKSRRLVQLTAGTRYRVELSGTGDVSWVRLAFSRLAPPAATLPVTAGLSLWLRSDQGVEVTNGHVDAWRDSSDAHRDAVPPTMEAKPRLIDRGIAERPTLRFDGDDMLSFMQLQADEFTVFWVAKSDWADAGDYDTQSVLGASTPDTSGFGYAGTDRFDQLAGSSYVGSVLVPRLITITKSGDQGWVEQAGSNGTFDFTGPGTFTQVGRQQQFVGSSFRGDLSEIVIYGRALSPSERLAVNRYLLERYAITAN
ncbi:MAG: hypothetical protein EOO73_14260 [Myxococcales bacterium]|nr:MAG: hypothetical protein EOO73_14260 [Myxococcales bacterium]